MLHTTHVFLRNDEFVNKDWKGGILKNKKKEACFADKDLSSWTGFGRSGHVQIPTFGIISHVSGPKLTFGGNFIMVLHGFASRSSKNIVFPLKDIFDKKKDPDPNKSRKIRKQNLIGPL